MRRNVIGKVLCLVALFLFTISTTVNAQVGERERRERETTLVQVGDAAPDFTVKMLDGRKVKLSSLKGKVVLLNFWATWCGACMLEMNKVPDEIIKRFKGKDFVMLAISRGELREVVQNKMSKLKKKNINFPVGLDTDKSIYSKYAKEQIPRNFVIDREGKISYASIGYPNEGLKELVSKIDDLLN